MSNELASTDTVIQVRDLYKSYTGGAMALNGASLTVKEGQIYGLIGPNGAGKTTMIKILLGLLRKNKGDATILGFDYRVAAPAQRANVAAISQEHSAYRSMTLSELCWYLSGLYPRWDAEFAEHLRGRFDLPVDMQLRKLSGGERRRASILLALATRSRVLIMDEPAANLDPMGRRALLEEIVSVLAERDSTTVLFSTHMLSDLERVASMIGVMSDGRVVQESPVEDLTSRLRKVQIIFPESGVPRDFSLPGLVGQESIEGCIYHGTASVPGDEFESIRTKYNARIQMFPVPLEDALIELMEKGTNRKEGIYGG